MKQLPPLSGLQAFEATAKHSSFTRAAVELGITQAAVSQRVRNLEELIGAKLFIRDGNSVTLTEAAQDFLPCVRGIFGELRLATDRLDHYDRGDVVCIACTGSFSIKCLIPLLPKFRAKYPDVNIKIRKLSSLDHEHSGYDIAIQYGTGRLAAKRVERLFREEVFPVCSPDLVKGLRTPADLSRHTIIRVVSPVFTWDEWPRWFDAAGYPDTRITQELACDIFFPSLQAAIAGLGIVMGRNILVKQDLDAGLLVEPFSTRLITNSAYYLSLSSTAERERRPAVAAFRDWLLETIQAIMVESRLGEKALSRRPGARVA